MSDYTSTSTGICGIRERVLTTRRDHMGRVTYVMVSMKEIAIDAIKAQPFFKPQENSDE